MSKLIERKIYTDKIKGFFGKEIDLIKVMTGIRRCGKSEVLKLIRDEALKRTDKDHVIFLDFEDYDNSHLLSASI